MISTRRLRPFALPCVAALALCGGIGSPAAVASGELPKLTPGESVTQGHWSSDLCVPSGTPPILIIPPTSIVDKTHLQVTAEGVATFSVAPAMSSVHPAGSATLEIMSADYPTADPLYDINGKRARVTFSGGSPTTVSVSLMPGNYWTVVSHGYCSGFFEVALDEFSLDQDPFTTKVKAVKFPKKSMKLSLGETKQVKAVTSPKKVSPS
ncbi:MAG: hypothetical protein FWD59_10555, partial [Micrococcales bacterium]|nr:hypothetical protein [Micrococcales bacterium]